MAKTCARGDGCHPSFDTSHAHAFDFWGNDVALPAHDDVTAPGGGLWSTAEDMAIWLRYQLGLIPSTTPELADLNALLPELRTKFPSGFGYSFRFSTLTFKDGQLVDRPRRFEADRGVRVRQPRRLGSERRGPSDVLRTELGEPLLEQFP